MTEAGTSKPAAFHLIVHSFSRFFRDHFELEAYVRKLAKNPGICFCARRSQFCSELAERKGFEPLIRL